MHHGQRLGKLAFLHEPHIAGYIGVGGAGGLAGDQGIFFLHGGILDDVPDGAGGADLGAGTAEPAAAVLQQLVVQGAHVGFHILFVVLQNPHAPQVAAGTDAPAAKDAAVHIVDDQRVLVVLGKALDAGMHPGGGNTHVLDEGLQFTAAVLGAGGAVLRVGSQQQFHGQLALGGNAGAVGGDLHAFLYGQFAGRLYVFLPVHLHNAQPAGPDVRQVGVVAQMGNVDAVLQSGFQHVHAGVHLQAFAVDFNGNAHNQAPFQIVCRTSKDVLDLNLNSSSPADMRRPAKTPPGKFCIKLCARNTETSARFDVKFCRGGVQEGE